MGEVMDYPAGASAARTRAPSTIDRLTAEVAIILWRLRGVASGDANFLDASTIGSV